MHRLFPNITHECDEYYKFDLHLMLNLPKIKYDHSQKHNYVLSSNLGVSSNSIWGFLSS